MLDFDDRQLAAVRLSAGNAWDYLSSIRKTDIETLDEEQAHTLCEVIVRGYFEHLASIVPVSDPATAGGF